MALSSFNPLTIFNDLRDSGMHEAQAQAVVRGCERTRSRLATREDIDLLRAEAAAYHERMEKLLWHGLAMIGTMIATAVGIIIAAMAAF